MLSKDLELAIRAAKKAGVIVRKRFGNAGRIGVKGGGQGFVTEADRKSEAAIIKVLSPAGYSFLGEETGSKITGSEMMWVVDPLDGTKNFARNVPMFGISIALLSGGKVVLGVVLNPVSGECFYGERGRGAFFNGKKMAISKIGFGVNSLVHLSTGYKQVHKDLYVRALSALGKTATMREWGSTALELCYVAKGHSDAFVTVGDMLWDFAAGILIVEEAGGIVTDWKGRAWDNSSEFVVASNRAIHKDLVRQISGLQQD